MECDGCLRQIRLYDVTDFFPGSYWLSCVIFFFFFSFWIASVAVLVLKTDLKMGPRFAEFVNLDILVLMVLLPNTVWKWKNGLEV